MTKEELKERLVEDAEYTKSDVENMSNFELFNAWLNYEGIIGYSSEICDFIK